jgi:hypothetical protein
MVKVIDKKITILLIIISTILLSGCGIISPKNNDFEYIKQRGAMKITIQSTRDKSYKFTVTDKEAIKDIYEILSNAKEVENKTDLEPDYIFEIYESIDKVSRFNYVAGLDKEDGANFYSDSKSYIVSKRLDNDIIKNFSNIRRPIDFENIYYESLYRTLEAYNIGENKNKKIALDISSDIEMAKFQLSTNLMYFDERLRKIENAEILNKTKEDTYDVVMKITTEGYTSTKYKAIITFKGKANEKPDVYYINNVYEQGNWKISIGTEKPKDF